MGVASTPPIYGNKNVNVFLFLSCSTEFQQFSQLCILAMIEIRI